MIYKRGRFYSVKFMFRGKVIRRCTRAMLPEDARAIEAKIRSELALGHWGILKPRTIPTLREFVSKYFLPFVEGKVKPSSMSKYRHDCKLLLASELASLRLDTITDEHAAWFASSHSYLSPSIVNTTLQTLQRCIDLAVEWRMMECKPKLTERGAES